LLTAAVVAMLLAAGWASVAVAVPRPVAAAAGPTDTEPPPTTTPAPDPAPPAPKPQPAPKPNPQPTPSRTYRPATTYHAPVPAPSPTPRVTYTPPVAHPRATAVKKPVHRLRKHRRPVKHVAVAPKPHLQLKHASVVRIGGVAAAATTTTNGADQLTRIIMVAGIGLAALLFTIVLTIPATAVRFTPPGRMLMDHQTDLVLVGVALLLLTALLFAVAGNGA
jgi:hypothetical protein